MLLKINSKYEYSSSTVLLHYFILQINEILS